MDAFAAVGVRRRNLGVGTKWVAKEVVHFRVVGVRGATGVLIFLLMAESAGVLGGDLCTCLRSTA